MRSFTLRIWSGLVALLVFGPASAQFWADAGQPEPVWNYNGRLLWTDTVNDVLYAGGCTPVQYEGLPHTYMPLFRYDGHSWEVAGLFGNIVRAIAYYNDTLFVGGGSPGCTRTRSWAWRAMPMGRGIPVGSS